MFDLWSLTQWSTIFQLYRRDRFYWSSTPEKPPICHKSLTNFIKYCCIEYTSPWKGFELTTLAVIGTDYTGCCKSNYHTITTTTAPLMIYIVLRLRPSKQKEKCYNFVQGPSYSRLLSYGSVIWKVLKIIDAKCSILSPVLPVQHTEVAILDINSMQKLETLYRIIQETSHPNLLSNGSVEFLTKKWF